ncbi:VCBS repeat-containing protein [Streptomyces sp. AV19]|uniref:FG-GAP repeat domain-containing protein n=1 Tax=Streptomyces sp. AV19 TaxID=2793068 RepID=UPI0018FE26F9|nr:VCBS repeat-containing protein [Streptomyces sp. AV19]MBH1938487.1 VCBS repeat-containing protein [Streptomyces sp. AV19]MDG4535136.1 VCBS repeat-containing protein [Streptomyces sp. AV19]
MTEVPTRRRAFARLVTAATAVALVGTTAGTAAAGALPPAGKALRPSAAAKADFSPNAPFFPVQAINRQGDAYFYLPSGKGGLSSREHSGAGLGDLKAATQVDHDRDGVAEGVYFLTEADDLGYMTDAMKEPRRVATDWGQYNSPFSPGTLGGSKQSDILVRDRQGTLWLYLAKADGSLSGRKKVGTGWGGYTAITGRGDLTGDGRTDIVARDKQGTLWLYPGTGNADKPFTSRKKIGGGWNQYNLLLGTGDVDLDGRADLLARDGKGALWLYKGTGKASSPYKSRVQIGKSGWNQYRLVF